VAFRAYHVGFGVVPGADSDGALVGGRAGGAAVSLKAQPPTADPVVGRKQVPRVLWSVHMAGKKTFIKFRRSCAFEGQLMSGAELDPFGPCFDTGDVEEFRDVWRGIRDNLPYESIVVTGEYFDEFKDLLPDGVSELQHLDAEGEALPCIGKPRIAERSPNRWRVMHSVDSDVVVLAWRVIHFPKGSYTYGLPAGLSQLDLGEVELRTREGLGDAPFFVAEVLFRGQPCELVNSEDGSGYSDCFAVHCWIRQDGDWRRVWALDDGMGDECEDWGGFSGGCRRSEPAPKRKAKAVKTSSKKRSRREKAVSPVDLLSLAKGLSISESGRLEAESGAAIWSVEASERLQMALSALGAAGMLDGVTHLDLGDSYDPDPPRSAADLDQEGDGAKALNDLGPLSDLKSLTSLNLSGCADLSDLGPLAALKSLTSLNLGGCRAVADLSPLSALRSLTSLSVAGDVLPDLGPLAALESLTSLDLGPFSEWTDLSPLSALRSLARLGVFDCACVTDLGPLSGLNSLTSLRLPYSESLSDLGPLSELAALRSLQLSGCYELSDLAPLSGLESLERLDLSGCASLANISPLSGLKSLSSLDLSECGALPEEHQRSLQGAELKEWLSALSSAGKTRTRGAKGGDKKTP